MNKELQDKLFKEFPNLYKNISSRGVDTDDGWYLIIYAASKVISDHVDMLKERGKVTQDWEYRFESVKEKFGTIRIYDNGGNEFTDGVISMAELLSSITCELCGKAGAMCRRGNGASHTPLHMKVVCPEHATELGFVRFTGESGLPF